MNPVVNPKRRERVHVKKYLFWSIGFVCFDIHALEIPQVPSEVVEDVRKKSERVTGSVSNMEHIIESKDGTNIFLPIASGFTNRIVTPFTEPEIISTSLTIADENGTGEIYVRSNVIYVSTVKDYPLSMFITQKGSETHAISLTLLPKKIPPREVVISVPEIKPSKLRTQISQATGETSEYILSIKKALRSVATNEVPQGYGQQKIMQGLATPECLSEKFKVSFKNGQILTGTTSDIYIGHITNITNEKQNIDEKICAGRDVLAIATWPAYVLDPSASTEIFVVKAKQKVFSESVGSVRRHYR